MDYIEFIKFPFQEKEWVKKLLLGCILLIIPVVNIVALGYFVECIRIGMVGKTVLPEWVDWETYLKQGLLAILISLAYMGIPLLFTFVLQMIPILGVIVSSVVTLIAGAMVPMAIANSVIGNSLLDAFKFGEIMYNIKKVIDQYAPAYFIMVLIIAIVPVIIVGVPIISFAGVFLLFYSAVVFSNYMGQLYNHATNA